MCMFGIDCLGQVGVGRGSLSISFFRLYPNSKHFLLSRMQSAASTVYAFKRGSVLYLCRFIQVQCFTCAVLPMSYAVESFLRSALQLFFLEEMARFLECEQNG